MGPLSVVCGLGHEAALSRASEAMLRVLGGGKVVVRFKGEPLVDGAGANPRLGLAINLTADVAFAPTAIRDVGDGTYEFVIAARPVQDQIDIRQTGTAQALFDAVLGVVREDKLLRIVNVSAESFAGVPYLYRLRAQE